MQRSLLSQLSQKIREFFDFTDQWNHMDYSLKFQVPSIGKIFHLLSYKLPFFFFINQKLTTVKKKMMKENDD